MGRIHANDLDYALHVRRSSALVPSTQRAFTPSRTVTAADFDGADTVAIELAGDTTRVPTLDDLRTLSDTIKRSHSWRNEQS
jgi:hypothetical protein